jgi:hypothetical protein
MENQEAYRRAKRRVAVKMAFYIHLAAYVSVNFLLLVINLATSTHYLWFKWPLIGWGIGLGVHALVTYALPKRSTFTERMIQKELERQAQRT